MTRTNAIKKAKDASNANGHTEKNESAIARSNKNVAMAIANLALVGCALNNGSSCDTNVSKWGVAHYCQDFDSLKAFAWKVGVTQ